MRYSIKVRDEDDWGYFYIDVEADNEMQLWSKIYNKDICSGYYILIPEDIISITPKSDCEAEFYPMTGFCEPPIPDSIEPLGTKVFEGDLYV